MGKMLYQKPEDTTIQGICVLCKRNKQKSNGNRKFKAICSTCNKKLYEQSHQHQKQRVLLCDRCGFTSEYACQFDADHIDGDHSNNDPDNLGCLCANCHRLKTFLSRESVPKKHR